MVMLASAWRVGRMTESCKMAAMVIRDSYILFARFLRLTKATQPVCHVNYSSVQCLTEEMVWKI